MSNSDKLHWVATSLILELWLVLWCVRQNYLAGLFSSRVLMGPFHYWTRRKYVPGPSISDLRSGSFYHGVLHIWIIALWMGEERRVHEWLRFRKVGLSHQWKGEELGNGIPPNHLVPPWDFYTEKASASLTVWWCGPPLVHPTRSLKCSPLDDVLLFCISHKTDILR